MFYLRFEDKEATRVANSNIHRIVYFSSLIRNGEFFLKLVLGIGIQYEVEDLVLYWLG